MVGSGEVPATAGRRSDLSESPGAARSVLIEAFAAYGDRQLYWFTLKLGTVAGCAAARVTGARVEPEALLLHATPLYWSARCREIVPKALERCRGSSC
jgi:hypothetical protein